MFIFGGLPDTWHLEVSSQGRIDTGQFQMDPQAQVYSVFNNSNLSSRFRGQQSATTIVCNILGDFCTPKELSTQKKVSHAFVEFFLLNNCILNEPKYQHYYIHPWTIYLHNEILRFLAIQIREINMTENRTVSVRVI